jgi:hypothetical protein
MSLKVKMVFQENKVVSSACKLMTRVFSLGTAMLLWYVVVCGLCDKLPSVSLRMLQRPVLMLRFSEINDL